jgi:hypothetical protein
MPSMRLNRSLSAKNLRPFKVSAVPEKYAVVLALPNWYKGVHLVFHPWLLHMDSDQLATTNKGNIPEALGDATNDGACDYYADHIIDCRIDKRRKDPSHEP